MDRWIEAFTASMGRLWPFVSLPQLLAQGRWQTASRSSRDSGAVR